MAHAGSVNPFQERACHRQVCARCAIWEGVLQLCVPVSPRARWVRLQQVSSPSAVGSVGQLAVLLHRPAGDTPGSGMGFAGVQPWEA